LESHIHAPADAGPLSSSAYPPEQSANVPLPGDLTDRCAIHWEHAWIDLGGEG
jgi:hypothetical protein